MTNVLIVILLLLFLFGAVAFVIYLRRSGETVCEMDDMEGLEFEEYCALLLEQNGFEEVEVTKGSGDFGVDILAVKQNVTYAFQCKCYGEPVGVKAVQEVYAGRDFYDCMVGGVMTNQYFTPGAQKMAQKLKILLWDRQILQRMVEDT